MKKTVVACVLCAMAGAALAIVLTIPDRHPHANGQDVYQQSRNPAVKFTRPSQARPPSLPVAELPEGLTSEEQVSIAVYDNVNTSVVNISTRSIRPDSFSFFETPSEGSGSGMVIDQAGHILTNYHVVEGAREIHVTLADSKTYPATVVGQDPPNDISVIEIEAPSESLHPVVFGESSRLRVGQQVYAIGNPFGLERTLTTGVISSLNRTLPTRNHRTLKSIIQIDAAINPGNSGGPLLDSRGTLIGMNTAIASRTGQSSGVGFAIPVNTIRRIVPQLVEDGRVIRPDAGIAAVIETKQGLLIAKLSENGPAARAGLRGPKIVERRRGPFVYRSFDRSAADMITAVNGQKVASADDFLTIVESNHPGDEVTLSIVRDGKPSDIRLRLEEEQP